MTAVAATAYVPDLSLKFVCPPRPAVVLPRASAGRKDLRIQGEIVQAGCVGDDVHRPSAPLDQPRAVRVGEQASRACGPWAVTYHVLDCLWLAHERDDEQRVAGALTSALRT